MLRVGRIEGEERCLDLLDQRRIEVATHRPVVVVVGRGGGDHSHLGGIDLAGRDQLVPDRGVEHAGVGLAGFDPGRSGVMGAGVGDALEVLLRLDAVLEHEVARHQAARGGGHRAEREGLALQVGQRLDLGIGGDELAGELLILLALHQRDRIAGLQARLHEGKAAEPGEIEAVGCQGLDDRGVIRHRGEFHRHAQLLFQIFAQRLNLRISSVGASSGMAETRRVSAAWVVAMDKDRARPATAARSASALRVLRFNSGKARGL